MKEEFGIPYSEDTKFFKDEELTMEIELDPDQREKLMETLCKAWGYEMIVRCKDCKHWVTLIDNAEHGFCTGYYHYLITKSKNGFCDRGELR